IQNNAGSSTIPAPTTLGATFSTYNAIDFYDFNSDGLIDIVAPYDDGTNYCLGIYECTGGYNYSTSPNSIIIGSHASSIGWISFVKMEDLDTVPGQEIVCQTGGYNTFVIKQNGIYSFTNYNLGTSSYTNTATGLNPPNGTSSFSAFTDIDNNGFKDIVINNSVFFQNSIFSFTRVNIMASPDIYYMRFVCDDLDGNGSKELWYNNGELTTHHSLYKIVSINCNAGQTFGAKQNKWFMHPILGHPLVDDFDNDGNYDLVYQSSGHIALSKKQGAAYIEKNILNGQYTFIDKIDLDNNGLTDLICQEDAFYNSQQRLRYLKNLGAGNFQDMGSIFNNGGNYYKVLATTDFDNDGDEDLFFLRQAGGYMKVSHYSNVSGTLTLQAEYDPIVSSGFDAAQSSFENAYGVVADMNNDGFKDLVVYYYKDAGTTYLCVFKNNNGVSFTRQYSTFINESLAIGASDLTGDGLPDILCTLSNQLKYLKNNGNFSFSATPILPAITSIFYNEVFSLIDVNADNLADIVNEDGGVISVAINQIGAFSSIASQGNSNSHTSFLDGYTIGNTGHGTGRANSWFDWYDYDSDGDNDIFIPENYNYVWENTTNSAFSINANLFYDVNGDGLKNGSDLVIPNAKLGIGSIQNYAYTTSGGNVTLPMGGYTGNFNVQLYSPYNSNFNFTTTHPAVATINNTNPSDTVNIGIQQTNPVINNHDKAISSHRCNEDARLWTSFNSISPYTTNGKLTLHYPTSLNYVAASTNPTNFSAGAITWNINNISPYSNNDFWTDFIMPNYTFMGDTLTFYSEMKTWFGSDTATTLDTFRTILTCAFDPNNKHIELNNSIIKGDKLYSIGDDIEYIINFQNTGNDTATNVVIKDFIPTEFDYNSLEFISASNNCSVSLNNNGLFIANFLNINLPDSSASFINSMGYVKFKLKLKSTAPHNVAINNSARIFFDLNPPILTNTETFYRVDCKFFASPINTSTSCANTSNTSYVLTHNISPSTYLWKLDGVTVSVTDTANYYISTTGNHTLSLNVTNAICNVDSTKTWNVSNAAPNLYLNFTGDTTICPGGPVYLSSLYNCQWYVNGTLNSTGYNFWGQAGQTITVNNTTGMCIRHDTITISQHNIPTNIINENVNNNFISFCSGGLDTVHLSTNLTSGFYWDYYDDNNDLYYYTPNVS
ncbi:MAG: VCBS repeat-containing protein, partial [Bacteroidia bacterium]|nr:VCBS repeat-containing protein [Bacteroidia bacterium]